MSSFGSAVTRGTVVSCRFPLNESPDSPGPTARPGLVVAVFDADTTERQAVVAYGTSRRSRANLGFEIRVTHPDSMTAAGLDKPTRFTLSRMRVLPVSPEYFVHSRHGTPVLGRLEDGLMSRLDSLCDILADLATPLSALRAHDATSHPAKRSKLRIGATALAARLDAFLLKHCTGRADLNGLIES